MLKQYVYRGTERLRCGYTTGSCATAAAKAAAWMLLAGQIRDDISIMTPKGIGLRLKVVDAACKDGEASCAVIKDSGDDPDITNGIKIYARVERSVSGIEIRGGCGIGIVTRDGLDQPKGSAAINSTPRKMIVMAVEDVAEQFQYDGGLSVTIYAPEGIALAKKTFNPAIGIEGGISIIGTSGIVEPMSTKALLDTIELEIRQHRTEGDVRLVLTLGNYGRTFVQNEYPELLDRAVTCSNYIGDAIDMALENGYQEIVIIGHIGKLVKLGAGIMNTHSAQADGRMEVLAGCGLRAGVDADILRQILDCVTVDEAIGLLDQSDMRKDVIEILLCRIQYYLDAKVKHTIPIHAVLFSNRYGMLGISHAEQTTDIKGE